jgi:alpha-ribazole phosphatase
MNRDLTLLMVRRLILLRHGETDWNREGRYLGQKDVDLSLWGERQVQLAAERLDGERIEAIYASDLIRTRRTAEIIAASRGLTVKTDSRFRELNFGAWEGLTYEEISTRFRRELKAWEEDPVNQTPPRGESLAALVRRVSQAWQEIIRKDRASTILLVGHGGPLRVLLCKLLGFRPTEIWRFQVDPGSVSILFFTSQRAQLFILNDTCHLEGRR